MIHDDTQSAQISQKQDEGNLYAIMKTMCPPGCHSGFVASHALGQMICGCTHDSCTHDVHHVSKCMTCYKAIVVGTGRKDCFPDFIYIIFNP